MRVETNADEHLIMELIEHTDRVSEVLKSLRLGTAVRLADASVSQAMMRRRDVDSVAGSLRTAVGGWRTVAVSGPDISPVNGSDP